MRINSRSAIIFALGLIFMAVLYHGTKSYFGISGRNADIATGLTMWSICVFMSGERILKNRLTVRDYFDIYNLSIVALVILGREAVDILLCLQNKSDVVAMLFLFMPVMALQNITKRVLFSNKEIEDLRLEKSRSKKLDIDQISKPL